MHADSGGEVIPRHEIETQHSSLDLPTYFSEVNKYAKDVVAKLTSLRNPEKAEWLENYIKHELKSLGVGIPQIRQIVQDVEKRYGLSNLGVESQLEFLNDLMPDGYTEPKIAAVLYIQLYWKAMDAGQVLTVTEHWFDNLWITDWNVCDWHCVRVLSPLLDRYPDECVSKFTQWSESGNLWKARASLVPLAQCKTIANHRNTIDVLSQKLIRRPERFCKTAVGWVMREYSKTDRDFVRDFLNTHKEWVTTEVIRNATKYLKD
jgi:3-methyladenine DNA glycosylase AlkD